MSKRKPCLNCGGEKEKGQQHYCVSCDTPEVREARNKAIKKRFKTKQQTLRQAEREGLPLADRKRVWHKDIPEGLGWCSRCKTLQPSEKFVASSRYCKPCRSKDSHARRIKRNFSLEGDQYAALLEHQGGRCAICRNKPGRVRLAVDHDHKCCPGDVTCGNCIRGLLCKKCNRDLLGTVRDDIETLRRAIHYLQDPPAQVFLMGMD